MSLKVALTATLTSFLIIAVLLTLACAGTVSTSNEALTVSLQNDFSLVYRVLCATDEGQRGKVLEASGRLSSVNVWYQGEDEKLIYTSSSRTDKPAAAQAAKAVTTMTTENAYNRVGVNSVFVTRRLPDGSVLLMNRQLNSFGDMLRVNIRGIVWQSVLVSLVVFFIVYFAVVRRQRLINDFTNTLDAVVDGNYDARLKEVRPFADKRREINLSLKRLCEKVFRQQTQNRALSSVINQMQHGLIAVDNNMTVILTTPVARKLLGIGSRCEGMPVQEVSKDVKLEDVFREGMSQDNVYTTEVAARTAESRTHRPLRLYVSPMKQDETIVGAIAMVEDITELRRLEQVRTDFAANVSHELKTPLTSIRGFVETLMDGAIDNPEYARKFLKIIMLETERLTRLINDILSISKLESGQNDVPKERIRIDKAAYDVADMLSIHAGEKNVTLNYHLNEKGTWIIGNKDHVEQMLINLIENGIKYNKPNGSVTVQVFNDESQAYISISDTGIGISEEHLPRMFERFYRVDKGRSRSMGGTGLGLAIVKHIVNTMNGNIEVHSKFGEGTEFLISLPLAEPGDDPDEKIADDDMA